MVQITAGLDVAPAGEEQAPGFVTQGVWRSLFFHHRSVQMYGSMAVSRSDERPESYRSKVWSKLMGNQLPTYSMVRKRPSYICSCVSYGHGSRTALLLSFQHMFLAYAKSSRLKFATLVFPRPPHIHIPAQICVKKYREGGSTGYLF